MLTPAQIMERLETIERELEEHQPDLSRYAEEWTRDKRRKEQTWAEAYMGASGAQVTDRKAAAIHASELIGMEAEAKYVGLKAVTEVLSTRAMIGQSLLKAHGRIG